MKKSSKKISAGWGGGTTSLFLVKEDGEIRLLNYENDTAEVHHLGGGRLVYESQSGMTGSGFITDLSALIPVGGYRVDTRYDGWTFGPIIETLGEEVEILLPTKNHITPEEQEHLLWSYPVIVRKEREHGVTAIFLLRWKEEKFKDTLQRILQGEEFDAIAESDGIKVVKLEKKFYYSHGSRPCSRINHLMVVDAFSHKWERTPYMWGYTNPSGRRPEDQDVIVEEQTRLESLFHYKEEVGAEGVYLTQRIGSEIYRVGYSKRNPLLNREDFEATFSHLGWKWSSDGLAYRYENRSQQIHVVCWTDVGEAFDKRVERLCRRLPETEAEKTCEWLLARRPSGLIEYEIRVPQALFVLKENIFAEARKGLAEKLSNDFRYEVETYRKSETERLLLGSLSEDTVVTFDDSIEAGNCVPGTTSFSDRYFGGARETTVGELKKFAHRGDVMRVLRYIALRKTEENTSSELE